MTEFFEPPPPPPVDPRQEFRPPPWFGPPGGTLPGVVALELLLAQTERVAVCIARRHRVTPRGRQVKEGGKAAAGGVSAVMVIVILGIAIAALAALYQVVLKKGTDVACHVANCQTVPNLNSNSLNQDIQNQAGQIARSVTLTTTTP